jgi:hypothetical protein
MNPMKMNLDAGKSAVLVFGDSGYCQVDQQSSGEKKHRRE